MKNNQPSGEEKCEVRGQHCYDKDTGHSCTVCCFCKMSYFWGEKVPSSPTVTEETEKPYICRWHKIPYSERCTECANPTENWEKEFDELCCESFRKGYVKANQDLLSKLTSKSKTDASI